jgi:DNA polymerase III epsilon subunit-like protein
VQLPLPEAPADALDYAVFDLETTGLDATCCQIIEIGWCVVRSGRPAACRSLLVRCATGVPPEVQALTGISTELLERDGIPLGEALRAFLAETSDLPLVGHNVLRFDLRFLEAACGRATLPPPHRSRYRDTAALYRAWRLNLRPRPGQDHWSFAMEALDRRGPLFKYALGACCEAFGIALDGAPRHRAAGDVALTQRLYARLCAAG